MEDYDAAQVLSLAALGFLIAAANPCSAARVAYEQLAFDRALEIADRELAETGRPLDCLEVRALVLTAISRPEEARGAWYELFSRDPSREVDDPSLSPATKTVIDDIRQRARPIEAEVRARWLAHDALRVDILLQGGLREATRVTWRTEAEPQTESQTGTAVLAGRAATATVAVHVANVDRVEFTAEARQTSGRSVPSFTKTLLLPGRPEVPPPDLRVVEVPGEGMSWWWWVALGAVAVAGAATAVAVALPNQPDADGTSGRIRVD